ncbi:homoserine kinase [Bartonella tamiae]|uniref:Homoserine kinase n=1 Tax=Bartonella tamiae Th239 TaxID=1094558 RepID=J0R4F8_9HYPH|nr:homoserine kinase [Bartonella tamiae]EJF90539.1 homoserine kinase [Bartonella tamiae Th239]EJF94083.1 homoserine kinase [Bartonella tamiae Th307]
MAVYTDIGEDELETFLSFYSIGKLMSYRGIAEGVENSNFMLHTDQGNFILTLYEKRVCEDDLPFFLGLMQHLSFKNVQCPQPVLRNDRRLVGQLAGRPAAIITFLEGMWMRNPNVQHCREVGKGLAGFHCAGQDFALSRKNNLSVSAWRSLWEKSRQEAQSLSPFIVNKIDHEVDFLEQYWPNNLPTGIIHADLFNDNVFFLNDHLSGIIDFYFSCNDYLAYDIAICLNAWCFERDFSYNLTKGQALLKNYNSVRSFDIREITAMPILARGASLRFLLTRLYDWFNTPQNSLVVKKDPMEYWRRLSFFQNVQSSSELGF